jgi:hypothetical protein
MTKISIKGIPRMLSNILIIKITRKKTMKMTMIISARIEINRSPIRFLKARTSSSLSRTRRIIAVKTLLTIMTSLNSSTKTLILMRNILPLLLHY